MTPSHLGRLASAALAALLWQGAAAAQDLTALHSHDATEDTDGVFQRVVDLGGKGPPFSPGGDARGPRAFGQFEAARYLMRPYFLDAGAMTRGFLMLSQEPVFGKEGAVKVYRPDGQEIPLPAVFRVGELPPKVLVAGVRTGEVLLRLAPTRIKDHAFPTDEVLVRVGPFPGLAGQSFGLYPYFQFPKAINENTLVETALDPVRHRERMGLTYDVYIVNHKDPDRWAVDPTLRDVTGTVERVVVNGTSLQQNITAAWPTGLFGDAGPEVGVPYDVVFDFDHNGRLDPGDMIDGLNLDEAGFYVFEDMTAAGPYAINDFEFDDPGLFFTEGFDGGSSRSMRSRGVVVYPDPLPPGKLPLVTFSHGNTGINTSYRGYRYLQDLLASYGYITASFDMFPAHVSLGIRWRGWLTNKNTERLILQTQLLDANDNPYPPMAGGLIDDKVDPTRIVTMGHSRGGEGVIVQYQQVANPQITGIRPPRGRLRGFNRMSFLGILGVAEVNFLTAAQGSRTDDRNFLLYFGSADDDVCGCSSGVNPTFHYNRAFGNKGMVYKYGAGHGYYNQLWSCTCRGPNLMTRPEVEAAAAGYMLPWVMWCNGRAPGATDFFTRSPDQFRPMGTETIRNNRNLVNLWRDGAQALNPVLDDYETFPSTTTSSSGQPVSYSVLNLFENFFGDTNPTGGWSATEEDGGFWWETRGAIWNWNGTDFEYVLSVDPNERDFTDETWLSFITCQQSDHPNTNGLDGPAIFAVTLVDGNGVTSTIRTRPYGKIDEPYKRSANGWGSAFKTFRLRLADFETDGSGLDLKNITRVRFGFGSNWGSVEGRLGFDDIELVRR